MVSTGLSKRGGVHGAGTSGGRPFTGGGFSGYGVGQHMPSRLLRSVTPWHRGWLTSLAEIVPELEVSVARGGRVRTGRARVGVSYRWADSGGKGKGKGRGKGGSVARSDSAHSSRSTASSKGGVSKSASNAQQSDAFSSGSNAQSDAFSSGSQAESS